MRGIDRDSHFSFQNSMHIIIIQTHWKKYPSVSLPKRKTPECKPNALRQQLFLSTLNSTTIFRIESCPPQMLNSKWSNKSPNFRWIMDIPSNASRVYTPIQSDQIKAPILGRLWIDYYKEELKILQQISLRVGCLVSTILNKEDKS